MNLSKLLVTIRIASQNTLLILPPRLLRQYSSVLCQWFTIFFQPSHFNRLSLWRWLTKHNPTSNIHKFHIYRMFKTSRLSKYIIVKWIFIRWYKITKGYVRLYKNFKRTLYKVVWECCPSFSVLKLTFLHKFWNIAWRSDAV